MRGAAVFSKRKRLGLNDLFSVLNNDITNAISNAMEDPARPPYLAMFPAAQLKEPS